MLRTAGSILGGLIPGLASGSDMLQSLLHPERAYKKAGKEAEKYYREGQGYQLPFYQQGQEQYGPLKEAENLLLHPEELESRFVNAYEISPYAKQLLEQNKAQGLDAASAMGLMGSSAAQGNIQQGAGNIVAKDREQFLHDLMEKYIAGIGIGENIYGIGANTAGAMGNRAMQQGENLASLRYGQEAAPGKMFENLIRTIGGFAPMAGNMFNPGSAAGAGSAFGEAGRNIGSLIR